MYDMAVDLVADEWNSFIQTFAFCPIIKKNNLSKVFYSSDGQVLSAQVYLIYKPNSLSLLASFIYRWLQPIDNQNLS